MGTTLKFFSFRKKDKEVVLIIAAYVTSAKSYVFVFDFYFLFFLFFYFMTDLKFNIV